jgi:hypothetical protein
VDDIWKGLLGAGEEIGKHAGPVFEEIGKSFEGFGREAGKHLAGTIKYETKIKWEGLLTEIKDWIEKHPTKTV